MLIWILTIAVFGLAQQEQVVLTGSTDSFIVELTINRTVQPLRSEQAQLRVLNRNSPQSVDVYALEAELFMPTMGHGTLPIEISAGQGRGEFQLSNLMFLMVGKWDLRLSVRPSFWSFSETAVVPIVVNGQGDICVTVPETP